MHVLRNYTSTLLLLLGITIGGICGMIYGEDASVVKPLGTLFMNFMFVLVVPIVCLSVSSAICRMKCMNLFGKVLRNTVSVFVATSLITAVLSYLCLLIYNPMQEVNSELFLTDSSVMIGENTLSAGEVFVNTLTVPEFLDLFQKPHLLPLIIFSVVLGLAIAACGEKAEPVARLLSSGSTVVLKMMDYLMYLAPVCLGCYFAYTIGTMGNQIVSGYLGSFILFLILTLILFFGMNTVYVWLAYGKSGLKKFWTHIITPSLTAIATTSSAACISVNIEAARKMGVKDSVAESVIPFGTNMHKDGSVAGNIIKVVFLICLLGGTDAMIEAGMLKIIFIALVSSLVIGAIPGGGMTGELLICSLLGYSPELAGILLVFSTIIDVPCTLLNSTGNVVSALLVNRLSFK